MHLSLSPLSPLPPRPAPLPAEIFPAWLPAQHLAASWATVPLPSVTALRGTGQLPRPRAERIAAWYSGPPTADLGTVADTYELLAYEIEALAHAVTGELGVQMLVVETDDEPYADAAELCADLRERGTLRLRAASADPPHPLLANITLDRLRMVHDVLGHAALGLGFDLQSEYAAWLYCRPLFSASARPAAFCELVGAVTTHVLTGARPRLRADLPPADLLTNPDTGAFT